MKRGVVLVVLAIFFLSLVAMPVIAVKGGVANERNEVTDASSDSFTLEIYGNANEDDTIDMRDVTYIKLVIFGKKPETELCDANYDGRISMLDVVQTKLIIVGKEAKLTLIDLADRTVTINKPVDRMVFVEGGHVGYIIALDAVGGEKALKKIVGMDIEEWKSIRQWIYSKYVEVYPWIKDIEDIGTSKALNVEKIIKLHPDVVLAPLYTKERIPVEKLEAAGIPIIFIDYHAETIENHGKTTLILGTLVDQRDRAKALVDLYEERVNMVSSRVAEVENKPKVYMESGYSKWHTYGRYMWGKLVKIAGGINIAWDLFERGGEVSPEYVLEENPDVIVVTGSYWVKRPESIWLGYYADEDLARERLKNWIERPGWSDINAVKNNRVYAIHHQLSRNIWDFIAVEYLAKCFYPDLFNDVDPVEDFKNFHDTFLSVDYSGVWMLSLEE